MRCFWVSKSLHSSICYVWCSFERDRLVEAIWVWTKVESLYLGDRSIVVTVEWLLPSKSEFPTLGAARPWQKAWSRWLTVLIMMRLKKHVFWNNLRTLNKSLYIHNQEFNPLFDDSYSAAWFIHNMLYSFDCLWSIFIDKSKFGVRSYLFLRTWTWRLLRKLPKQQHQCQRTGIFFHTSCWHHPFRLLAHTVIMATHGIESPKHKDPTAPSSPDFPDTVPAWTSA